MKRFDQFTLAHSSPFLKFIEGHLSTGNKSAQNYDCRRISVIVYRSVSDKLAVDSLVLLVWSWVLFLQRVQYDCTINVTRSTLAVPTGFFVLRHPNICYLQTRTIATLSLPTDSSRPLFKQIEIFSGILTVYFNCKYFPFYTRELLECLPGISPSLSYELARLAIYQPREFLSVRANCEQWILLAENLQ